MPCNLNPFPENERVTKKRVREKERIERWDTDIVHVALVLSRTLTHALSVVNKVSRIKEMQWLLLHNSFLHLSCANKTCFEYELKAVKRVPFIDVK